MGVLLLIRATTEGSADHWIQKIRETGVRTQKLRVSDGGEGADWQVDGDALKEKLKAIGMVITGVEVQIEDTPHEETTANGHSAQHEVTENALTGHHNEIHHIHATENTEKVDHERTAQTHVQHSLRDFPEHHNEHPELHIHHETLHVTIEEPEKVNEDRNSPAIQHTPPRSPRNIDRYRANLDPNRFVTPPSPHSPNSHRSKSMPKFVNARFSKLLASANVASTHEKTEKSVDNDVGHQGWQGEEFTLNQESFAAGHASHRTHDYVPVVFRHSDHESLKHQEEHQPRNENRRSTLTIRGREEINRGFAEHPVSRRPKSAGPMGPPQQVYFGTPHTHEQSTNEQDAFRFDSVLSDHKENAATNHHAISPEETGHKDTDHHHNEHEHHNTTTNHHATNFENNHESAERADSIGHESNESNEHEQHQHEQHHEHQHEQHQHEQHQHEHQHEQHQHEQHQHEQHQHEHQNEQHQHEQHQNEHTTTPKTQPLWQLYEKDLVFKKHDQVIRKYLTATSSRKLAAHAFKDSNGNSSDSD